MMVMTVLEADMSADNGRMLEEAYRRAIQDLESGMLQTFLLRESGEGSRWRIETLWESREALIAMRTAKPTPTGIQLFREAEAEPNVVIFEVVSSASNVAAS